MALLIYDMQVGIVSRIKYSNQIIAGVVQVLEAARKAGIRVSFSWHMSLP
jgi:biuret amidohydrolase